jgi:hypothetical protein
VAYSTVTESIITKNGVNYNLQYNPVNGKVQVIEENAAPDSLPIYQDGSWNANANQIGIVQSEKLAFHNTIQESIRSAHAKAGGNAKKAVLPQWAQLQNQGNSPSQTSITPANGTAVTNNGSGGGLGSVLSGLLNAPEAIKNVSVTGSEFNKGVGNEKELFGRPMVYPLDLRRETQDNFVISQFRYKPSKAEAIFGGIEAAKNTLTQGFQVSSNFNLEELIGTVYLPMPNSISDLNAVSWGEDNMNNLAAAVTANTLGSIASTGIVGGVGSLLGIGADKAIIAKQLLDLIRTGSVSKELEALIGAGGASKLLKLGGFGVETESILARGAGVVPNSNLEFLFQSPVLRQFSFTYRLSPRSSEEAQTIRRIIRFFKQGMAARKITGKAGQASFFLGTPNVFKLEYRTGKERGIDALNKFKTCALTSFRCDYSPDGFWAAYDNGQPVSTTMTLSFNELEPIYDTDYQEDIFDNRNDLTSISNNAVGY